MIKGKEKNCEWQEDINFKGVFGCNNCNLDIGFCIFEKCEHFHKETKTTPKNKI